MAAIYLNNGDTRFVSFVFWDEVYIVKYTIVGPIVNPDDIREVAEDILCKANYSVCDFTEMIDAVMSKFDVEYEIVSDESIDVVSIINNE